MHPPPLGLIQFTQRKISNDLQRSLSYDHVLCLSPYTLEEWQGCIVYRKGELSLNATRRKKHQLFCICNTGPWEKKKSYINLSVHLSACQIIYWWNTCFLEQNNRIEHGEIRHTNDRISISNWQSTDLAEFPQDVDVVLGLKSLGCCYVR